MRKQHVAVSKFDELTSERDRLLTALAAMQEDRNTWRGLFWRMKERAKRYALRNAALNEAVNNVRPER